MNLFQNTDSPEFSVIDAGRVVFSPLEPLGFRAQEPKDSLHLIETNPSPPAPATGTRTARSSPSYTRDQDSTRPKKPVLLVGWGSEFRTRAAQDSDRWGEGSGWRVSVVCLDDEALVVDGVGEGGLGPIRLHLVGHRRLDDEFALVERRPGAFERLHETA